MSDLKCFYCDSIVADFHKESCKYSGKVGADIIALEASNAMYASWKGEIEHEKASIKLKEREACIHIVRMQIARMRMAYMGIAASCLETCLKEMEERK